MIHDEVSIIATVARLHERYGKDIDYARLKGKRASDIRSLVEITKRRAHQFRRNATVIQIHCPLCGGKRVSPFVKIYEYPYDHCHRCQLVYLRTRLTKEAIVDYWKIGHPLSPYEDEGTYRYRLQHVASPKVEFVIGQYKKPKGSFLDLGCGIGDALVVAKRHGWRVLGLEVSQPCCEFVRKHFNVPILPLTIQDYVQDPNHQKQWDVIFASGYFDLIDNPGRELALVAKLLKPGGLLFMLNPNWKSLTMNIAQRYPDQMYRFVCPPETLSLYCDNTYQFICREFGFKEKAYWYFGMDIYELVNQLAFLKQLPLADRMMAMKHIPAFQLLMDQMRMSDYTHVILEKI